MYCHLTVALFEVYKAPQDASSPTTPPDRGFPLFPRKLVRKITLEHLYRLHRAITRRKTQENRDFFFFSILILAGPCQYSILANSILAILFASTPAYLSF